MFIKIKLSDTNIMKRLVACSLILSTLLMGCSHLLPIKESESRTDYYTRINSGCEGEDVTITLLDGTEYSGNTVQITTEQTTWFDNDQKDVINIPTDEIKSVSYNNNGFGMGDGAIIGAGIFYTLGFILGVTTGPISFGGSTSSSTTEHIQFGLLLGIITAIPGLLLGGIAGSAIGSETTFEIN